MFTRDSQRFGRFVLAGAITLSAAALVGVTPAAGDASGWQWDDVGEIVAVGDVHGAVEKLILLLQSTGLVDGNLSWTGRDRHLVLNGDLVDRGWADRAVLDLARRLQQEAEQAGGRVHILLGNHEVMNLVGDLRYVSVESFAEFADLERPSDREAGWSEFKRKYQGQRIRVQEAFDQERPPGYFGRLHAMAPDGEYGSWLAMQPAAIKINGFVFVHGGLTPEVAALGLDGINERMREAIAKGGTKSTTGHLTRGPLWYRGNSLENERIERRPLAEALRSLDARGLVVGHTPTASRTITSRFKQTLYRTDVGLGYGAAPLALIIEGEEAWAFDPATFSRLRPLQESPQGEHWSNISSDLPDEYLETYLALADITDKQAIERGGRRFKLLELEHDGVELRAVFQFVEERPSRDAAVDAVNPRRFQHEIAAYRLSRELGLDAVPVTVARKVGGKRGAISIWPEAAIDLPYIRDHGRWDLLRGLERQIGTLRLFSALVGSRDRLDAAKMLVPPERRILIADSSKGFPLTDDVDDFLVDEVEGFEIYPCRMNASFELRLRALETTRLTELLGDLLSDEQIEALVARRDRLLSTCEAHATP